MSIYEKVKAKYEDQYEKTEEQKKLKEDARAELHFERLDKARIAKMKIVERSNTSNARYKSVEQAIADKQFAELSKPERMKRSTKDRTTIKVADVWTKVNLKIIDRFNEGYYNGFGLRGTQVKKWIHLYKNNFDREKTAETLGIQEDSLRKSMNSLVKAMRELFLETFDENFNENPMLKSDIVTYFSSELEKAYK